jgi:uncharacterized protein YjbI with pentapeptide repeats/energy-coupling factor transporter ATP-binding protein EcfA2
MAENNQSSKLLLLNLGMGNLQEGLPAITAQVWTARNNMPSQFRGSLPPAPQLAALYQDWKLLYEALHQRLDWQVRLTIIDSVVVSQVSDQDFEFICKQLRRLMNEWLSSESFLGIDRALQTSFQVEDEIQVIFETEDPVLRRLPWHLWKSVEAYLKAEIALSAPQWQHVNPSKSPMGTVRVLGVFGNADGIDLSTERELLSALPGADVVFLEEPDITQLNLALSDIQGWNILFFAGHSQTEGESGRIHLNSTESLTISQMEEALTCAIENGLQISIFNSCDGLGLAKHLEGLNIPHVIVMRELVLDSVAQNFLRHFLKEFASGSSFYFAVREARRQLEELEGDYPCASWLPVICQNPTASSPTWESLRFDRPDQGICPYKGLAYFDCNDEDPKYFYGRNALIEKLLDKVNHSNFVAIVGASGSGKSSVLRAGLLHRIQQQNVGLEQNSQWQIHIMLPGEHPLENLARAFLPNDLDQVSLSVKLEKVQRFISQGSKGLQRLLQDLGDSCHILVVDQFEEIFTLCHKEAERQYFFECLLGVLDDTQDRFRLILSMRADFFGQCLEQQYSGLAQRIEKHLVAILPMTRRELEDAITLPARKVSLTVESELVKQILDDVEDSPAILPLIQYTLTQLWKQRAEKSLQLRTYVQLGGVSGALRLRATEGYNKLSTAQKNAAQHIFLALTHLGVGTEDTRRRVLKKDLITPQHPEALIDETLKLLADENLIVTNQLVENSEKFAQAAVVDVAHEAVIRHWPLLRVWIEANRDLLSHKRRIEMAAEDWCTNNKTKDYLLQGNQLRTARKFRKEQAEKFPLSESAVQLIQVSIKQRATRRRELIGISIVVPFFLSVYAGINIEKYFRLRPFWDTVSRDPPINNPTEVLAIQELVKAGESLQYISLRNANLKGMDFYRSDFSNTVLNKADFTGSDFTESNFHKADLSGAILTKASLAEANLSEAVLINANLSQAAIYDANLSEANLTKANLVETNLIESNLQKANLFEANLDRARISGAKLVQANLNGASLVNARLIKTNLKGAILYHANLQGSNLKSANLEGANLTGANLESANLKSANLKGSNLKGANLKDVKNLTIEQLNQALLCDTQIPLVIEISGYKDCNNQHISNDNFKGLNAKGGNFKGTAFNFGTNFSEANLADTDFSGVDFSSLIFTTPAKGGNAELGKLQVTNFSNANLSGANFSGVNFGISNLKGANLKGANLKGTYLKGAYFIGEDLSSYNVRNNKYYEYYLSHVSELSKTNFYGADLQEAILNGVDFKDSNLQNANLLFASLTFANLSNAKNLSLLQLRYAKLCLTKLPGGLKIDGNRDCNRDSIHRVILANHDLRDLNLNGVNFNYLNLYGFNLSGFNLSGAKLVNADLSNIFAPNASFIKTNLSGANLSLAVFSNANFTYANLSGAILNGTNFNNSNLYKTNLYKTNIMHARNLTMGQLNSARICQTQLPDIIKINPDRDC